MPDPAPSISFHLPEAVSVEGYLVELGDGRRVIRTRDELVELAPELRVDLPRLPEEEPEK